MMTGSRMKPSALPMISAAALALTMPTKAAIAQDIGTIALSVAQVTGTPPGAAARALQIGSPVVMDEEVSTGAASRAEVLFRDQTSLSLGANTAVVLDRFVFDPRSGTGELAIGMTQGVLRFIGGTLSDTQPALVTTPTATIGIRGSSALISSDGERTIAVFIAGDELCLSPNATAISFCTAQLGGLLTEQGFGGIVPPDLLAQISDQIDQITAPDGQTTDLGQFDLGAVVPVDVQPFATGGSQPPQTPQIVPDPPPVPPQTTPVTQPPPAPPQTTPVTQPPPAPIPPSDPPGIPSVQDGDDDSCSPNLDPYNC
jgi:hypothetical protein